MAHHSGSETVSLQGSDVLRRDEARERAATVAEPVYIIDLDLDSGDETFGCEATVRFRGLRPGAATFIDFRAEEILQIELNGHVLGPEAVNGGRITLAPVAAENTFRISARCAYTRSGSGMYWFRDPADGNVYLYTDFEPREAHRVYPCFDQPDLKGTFEFTVKARPGWQVVANTAAIESPPAGEGGRFRFARTRILPTYVTAVCAGPYHGVRARHRELDLGVYCRQSLAAYLDAEEIIDVTRRGFDFFEELFAYPYAFGKYDQIFVPEYNSGAMENAGCITHNEYMIFRSRVTAAAREDRALTILHEMAHMWFGDLVTMRWWDDLWLNESFATYMGQLALVRATRFKRAWATFARMMKPWAYRQDQLPTTHPIVADAPDTEAARTNFDGISYAKGASVLKQLVAWVGEEAFISGVREYFRRYEFKNADLSAFLGAVAEASGRDLSAWAAEWLEKPGVNTLAAEIDTGGDGSTVASFAIAQTAPQEWPTLRSHRVAIGLYERDGDTLVRRRQFEVDIAGARTSVPALRGERLPALVLINDEDLTFAKMRLDLDSRRTLREDLKRLEDPLARALCWSAAYEEMRDAIAPARDYMRLVLDNIAGEEEIGLVQSLIANCAAAINVFGDPTRAERARLEFATAAWRALEDAEPESDFQLAWAQAFIAAARSPEHVALLEALLEGRVPVPGLTIDTDLRWHIIHSLAAGGAIGEERIAAELERDATDSGQRRAVTARAALPTADAKAAAWRAIVGDGGLPLAMRKAWMGGFMRHDQAVLLAPYGGKFFAALPAMWAEHDIEVAMTFARTMYPMPWMSQELLKMTEQFLVSADPPPPVRRYLLEGADDVRRALRARALDAAAESA